MRWILGVFLATCATLVFAEDKAKYSGKFGENGERPEEFRFQSNIITSAFPDDIRLPKRDDDIVMVMSKEELGLRLGRSKTIAEWGLQVASARSNQFQQSGAKSLEAIAESHYQDRTWLADGDVKQLREVLLKLAAGKSLNGHVARALAFVADDNCLSLFNKLILHDDPAVSRPGIVVASRIGNDESVKALHKYINDSPGSNRLHVTDALTALRFIGSKAARAALEDIHKHSKLYSEEAAAELDKLDAK